MGIDTDPISAPEKKISVLNTMHEVIKALRVAKTEITFEGKALEVGRTLGKGGSKTVKEVFIGGERLALALPK
ncbi:MAG TPA: hypothetical protein VFZ58_00910 [Candidatus Saccharimonadales bacterium]